MFKNIQQNASTFLGLILNVKILFRATMYTTVFLLNTFSHQGHSKLNKSDRLYFYIETLSISNKCCYFELYIHEIILKKNDHDFHKNISSASALIIIRNVS